MAGTTSRDVMSVREAKERLRELGTSSGTLINALIGPGAAVAVGIYLGAQLRRGRREQPTRSLASVISGAVTVIAPVLVEQFIAGVLEHMESRRRQGRALAPYPPDDAHD